MSKTSKPDEQFFKELPTELQTPIDMADSAEPDEKPRRRSVMPVHSVIAKLDRQARKNRKGKGES